VLTLPVIDTLKKCYPQAEIDFLVNKRVYELVEDYANAHKVISTEDVTSGAIKSLCKSNGYDLAVVVHPRFSIALGLYLGGVKHRLGTAYRWYSFLFNIKHYQHRKESVKHELEYNLDLLTELECDIRYSKPVINVKQVVIKSVSDYLNKRGVNTAKFIVIHIPSLGSAKVWSDENFIKLINLITSHSDIQIVLTGTPDDKSQIENAIAKLDNAGNVYPVYDLNLKHIAALLQLSKLFIGNSTGPIHIAAAVGTFCIGIYSPVRVESAVRWGPYTETKKIFQPDSDVDSKDVMDDIKPDEVFEFVRGFLKT
jgi:ADP-heptose:LPS heptosyltransferase